MEVRIQRCADQDPEQRRDNEERSLTVNRGLEEIWLLVSIVAALQVVRELLKAMCEDLEGAALDFTGTLGAISVEARARRKRWVEFDLKEQSRETLLAVRRLQKKVAFI